MNEDEEERFIEKIEREESSNRNGTGHRPQRLAIMPQRPDEPPKKKRRREEHAGVAREINELVAIRRGKANRGVGSGGWMPYERLKALNRAVNSKAVSLLSRLRSGDVGVVTLIRKELLGITGTYPDPEVSSILVENLEYISEKDPKLIMSFLEPLSQINFQLFLRNKLIVLSQTLLQHVETFDHLNYLTKILFRYGSYGKYFAPFVTISFKFCRNSYANRRH